MSVIMKDNVQYGYTTKGTVFHTLSNAEYEALTEEEKMNGDVYCIPDREPVINPDQLWEKVGTGTLDIGSDLTDGVNQLNSSLNVIGGYYTMGWMAASSNAADVQLTNKTNLPRGTYIAIGSAPIPSVKDFPIALACSGSNNTRPFFNGIRDRSVIAFIVQINDDTADVWLKTASANDCTYSNINQSSIRFIRII